MLLSQSGVDGKLLRVGWFDIVESRGMECVYVCVCVECEGEEGWRL